MAYRVDDFPAILLGSLQAVLASPDFAQLPDPSGQTQNWIGGPADFLGGPRGQWDFLNTRADGEITRNPSSVIWKAQ